MIDKHINSVLYVETKNTHWFLLIININIFVPSIDSKPTLKCEFLN